MEVVAYHAALQFFGKAQSLSRRYSVLTEHRLKPVPFQGAEFVPVLVPQAVRSLPEWGGGITTQRHAGGIVRVTPLERTLVDVLDQPDQGGDWEEIWRSLEAVEYFEIEAVIAYAVKLKSLLTTAKVGFFLEQHRESLMVEEHHLTELGAQLPKMPLYFDRRLNEPGRLVAHLQKFAGHVSADKIPGGQITPERLIERGGRLGCYGRRRKAPQRQELGLVGLDHQDALLAFADPVELGVRPEVRVVWQRGVVVVEDRLRPAMFRTLASGVGLHGDQSRASSFQKEPVGGA